MLEEFIRMKWNEKTAVILGGSGGIMAIGWCLLLFTGVINDVAFSPVPLICLGLIWGGCCFLPPIRFK